MKHHWLGGLARERLASSMCKCVCVCVCVCVVCVNVYMMHLCVCVVCVRLCVLCVWYVCECVWCVCECVCVNPMKVYKKQSPLGRKRERGAALIEPQCDGVERGLLRWAEQR